MTWTVTASFPVLIGLIEQKVPGVPGCANITGYLSPYVLAGHCQEASVSFPVVAGGTYYLFVAPQFWEYLVCPADYAATLTRDLCGDFDADGDVDVMDYYAILAAFGTCSGHPKYMAEADADGDGCITLVDYQSWLVCYEDANGAESDTPDYFRSRSQAPRAAGWQRAERRRAVQPAAETRSCVGAGSHASFR